MSDPLPASWYADLAALESKGSAVNPVGGLAGLAAARAEHQGQFFTPLSLVAFLWQVTGLFAAGETYPKITILDSAGFGSGRMFAFADPRRHTLAGIEADEPLAEQVQAVARRAGFERSLEVGSFDEFRGHGTFTVGLLNPPFSLTIDTPYVEPAPCNAYGKYGPQSSALSHVFAVWQALQWCRHVAAVVPKSFGDAVLGSDPAWAWARDRLVAVYTIPRAAFVAEGANVETVVCLFGPRHAEPRAPHVETVRSLGDVSRYAPRFDLRRSPWHGGDGRLTHVRDDATEPAITLPHTGDATVRVVHDGRKIGLRFACGLTQGRVLNAIYQDKAHGRHMPKGIRQAVGIQWEGQGWFDLENYVAQPLPLAAFGSFLMLIRAVGGVPEVDPAIPRLLARWVRRAAIEREPFRHVAYVTDGGVSRWMDAQDEVIGTCREAFRLPGYTSRAPCCEAGEVVTFTRAGRFSKDDRSGRRGPKWPTTIRQYYETFSQDEILRRFDVGVEPLPEGWHVIHGGLAVAFPAEAATIRARALALGLDRWCSWGYQFDDLIELAIKGRGIAAWEMGLGKARLALALCMLGGAHNLITVEAHLLDEMRREIEGLGLPAEDWQIITKPEHARSLRRINLIAYSRLKAKVDKGKRRTFADMLRRRIHTHVCDEGHILRNDKTDQTRAVWKVSAKRRYLMSGTPIANYPRDMLPLLQWAGGDGIVAQVYGKHRPYMREENLRSIGSAPRGIDMFREQFVVTEWITNEFADDLRSGAKREVPEIADVPAFRAAVAPWVKRRVLEEPDVAAHISMPETRRTTTTVEWDRLHLAFYVKVAKEFVDWFKNLPEYQRKGANMIAVLAKMQAVQRAANFPAHGVRGQGKFPHVTSKQRHAINRLLAWAVNGHKSILLCESPDMVDWFGGALAKHGIEAVRFHGQITIAKRIKALDKDFRFGDAPVLLATKHTLQTGYNIHQADRVLVYDRTWTPKTEHQACARVLRPQQRRPVLIEFVHLPGSIDEYQAQMVEAKAKAMRAGLDYGGEERTAEGFQHIETILGRFVEEFEQRFGVTARDLIAEIGDHNARV